MLKELLYEKPKINELTLIYFGNTQVTMSCRQWSYSGIKKNSSLISEEIDRFLQKFSKIQFSINCFKFIVKSEKRLEFCRYHLENNSDWTNVLFTDESAFYLNHDHRWVWKRKGEWNVEAIQHRSSKYSKKVMMFGGICYKWKTPLICIDGNIDSITYFDECIDGTDMIPMMN